jgi:hypothetical protein
VSERSSLLDERSLRIEELPYCEVSKNNDTTSPKQSLRLRAQCQREEWSDVAIPCD